MTYVLLPNGYFIVSSVDARLAIRVTTNVLQLGPHSPTFLEEGAGEEEEENLSPPH